MASFIHSYDFPSKNITVWKEPCKDYSWMNSVVKDILSMILGQLSEGFLSFLFFDRHLVSQQIIDPSVCWVSGWANPSKYDVFIHPFIWLSCQKYYGIKEPSKAYSWEFIRLAYQIKEQLDADVVIVKDAYGDGRHVRLVCFGVFRNFILTSVLEKTYLILTIFPLSIIFV